MYIVAVAASTRSASRSEPEELYLRDMADGVTHTMDSKLIACAAALEIDQQIGWWLYNYWG